VCTVRVQECVYSQSTGGCVHSVQEGVYSHEPDTGWLWHVNSEITGVASDSCLSGIAGRETGQAVGGTQRTELMAIKLDKETNVCCLNSDE
jgi:hypothetical protein